MPPKIKESFSPNDEKTNYSNNLNKYDFYGAMKIKSDSLFTQEFLNSIKKNLIHSTKDSIQIGNKTLFKNKNGEYVDENIRVNYDSEYGVIRINNKEYGRGYPININIEEGTIYVLDTKELKQDSIILLQKLKSLGILKENIPYVSNEKLNRLTEENNFVSNFIEKNNSKELPFESTNLLNPKKTISVLQQEGIILNNPKEGQALYTFGAGPCLIMTVYDKETGKMGLTHIDATINKDKIISFLSYFGGNPDIKLISGDSTTTTKVIKAIKNTELEKNISFMNVDLNGARSDAAGIVIKDGEPKVVYGYNPNIKLTNEEEQKFKMIGYDISGNLKINIKP